LKKTKQNKNKNKKPLRKTRAATDHPGYTEMVLVPSTKLIANMIATATMSRSFKQRHNHATVVIAMINITPYNRW